MHDGDGGLFDFTSSSSSLLLKLFSGGDVDPLNTVLSWFFSGVVGGMSGRPCGSLGVFSLCVL